MTVTCRENKNDDSVNNGCDGLTQVGVLSLLELSKICYVLHMTFAMDLLSKICKIARYACVGNAGKVFSATAAKWSRHASRHVRDARAVMHDGIANKRFPLNPVAGKTFLAFLAHAQTRIITYLVIGPLWYGDTACRMGQQESHSL